jgi:hypothetical protein
MRPFVLRLTGFFALQAVFALPLGLRMLHQPAYDGYLTASVRKHERLERLAAPRIVFVGGSATAFGVDSPRVERELGRPVVNMGLYFPLGLEFMLNEVREDLRPGDVVVISPEYPLLFFDASADSLKQLLAVHPRALRWLGPGQVRSYLDQVHKPLGASARRALVEWLRGPEPAAPSRPPYSLDSFNDQGDVVAHHGMQGREIGRNPNVPGTPDDPRFRGHLERLRRFDRECRSRGISCFLSYPAVVQEGLEGRRAAFDAVTRSLEEDLPMAKLHGPEEMIFPAALFFDTEEHLSYEGKERRTRVLIDALKSRLKP